MAPPVTTHPYDEAYRIILAEAGAALPTRDAVDQRLIRELETRTGRIIDHPAQVGGWPELQSAPPPKDTDNDGMPDAWEKKHGLGIHDARDNSDDKDGDGYTNIEEWLNSTDPTSAQARAY